MLAPASKCYIGGAGQDMLVCLKDSMPSSPGPLAHVQLDVKPDFGPLRLKQSAIGFTHDSINQRFQDGRLVRETLRPLRDKEIEPSIIPVIKVCHHAANTYSSRFWTYTGNRRLWVFRQLEDEGLIQEIDVLFVDKTVPSFRMTTKNGGKSLRLAESRCKQ